MRPGRRLAWTLLGSASAMLAGTLVRYALNRGQSIERRLLEEREAAAETIRGPETDLQDPPALKPRPGARATPTRPE